jgi:putative ABC transport system permease protein
MKYLPLIWSGMWRKRVRTTLTLLSVMIAFLLVGVLSGVDAAFAHALAVSRLDRLFVDAVATMPLSYGEQIMRVPGVTLVAPRWGLEGYYQDPKNYIQAIGTDERFFAMRPELTISKQELQALRQTRTGAVVDVFLAQKYGWRVGDKIPIHANYTTQSDGSRVWTFDLVGLIDDADQPQSQFFITNYAYLDESRASDKGTIDRFLVRINDPKRATQIGRQIDDLFANSSVPTRTSSERSAAQSGLQSFGDAQFLTHTVVGAVLFMLLFVTGNTMMQSIRERVPEFAMLKTVGFSDRSVLSFVIAESVLLCAFAALAGLLLSKALISLVHTPPYSYLLFQMPWTALIRAVGLALAVAIASAFFPAWRVQRLSIVDALAGR